jgi:NhaA family Na+:H+ antiporter
VPDERFHSTWLSSDRFIPARFLRPVLHFTRVEAAGGLVLLGATVGALVWANLPFTDSYERFWQTRFDVIVGPFTLYETLRGLVNDGLMALFFFVVGLEIKRELVHGELRDPKTAALPVMAAVGGMVVPALIYLGFAGSIASRGWAVPVATDIAFSLGVLALLSKRVPVGARLFLLTLAIADDIGGITVIAIGYTGHVETWWFLGALAALAAVWGAGRAGVRATAFYGLAAAMAWLCLLESGVHAAITGVALALLTPARALYGDDQYRDRARRILARHEHHAEAPHGAERIDAEALILSAIARESVAPVDRMERALHPWSSFLVVPIFALANAGVRFAGLDLAEAAVHPVTLGVGVGLLAGKVVGISGFTWLAVRLGWGRLPRFTGWRHVIGVSALAGIGFTVALFITGLAFTDPGLADRAKLGIFAGSIAAGILGYLVLRSAPAAPAAAIDEQDAPE